jgi:MYXO-CTERM domain-containing protein
MNRFAAVVATVVALAVAPATADPVEESLAGLRAIAGPELSHLRTPGQPALRTLAGRLTVEPTADLQGAALHFLATHGRALGLAPEAALRFDRELPLRSGAVLRYRERLHGIPVVRGEVALRFDGDGILRLVNSSLKPFTAVAPPEPLVGSADAVAEVLELPGLIAAADPDRLWAGLVYYPRGGEARLAWQVETGAVPAMLANWVTWVDARSGELLGRENRVWFDRLANVFEENPVATPTVSQVTLEALPAWAADPYYLTGELILARNCIDRHELTPVDMMGFSLNVHICTETQVAAGDASHDFLYTDNTDTAPEDLFAEAAMYYHATKVYEYFQGLGFGELPTSPLAASVNFRIPLDPAGGFDMANLTNPDGVLYPFDNAMFMPAGEMSAYIPRDLDSMLFGQGTLSDFSYDGDIVYHEFTHAVTWSEINWIGAALDDQGLDIGPGALSEAYSDIFAMFLTGDSEVGEYGGAGLPGGAIRDLENDSRCPDDMIGEVHQDSVPFSSAAWELYQLHGEALAQPYYDALMTLVSDSDFAQAATATLSEISAALGATVAAEARTEFERRNVADCQRIVDAGSAAFPMLMGEGTGSLGTEPYVPGYATFRVTIPAGQRQVRAEFQAQAGGMFGGTITPHLLWRKGPDPLEFTYRGAAVTDNADHTADAASLGSNRYEGVYCEADHTLDPGDYFVMIANRGSGAMTMTGIRITYNDSEPDVPCVGDPDPETDGGTDVPADVPADGPEDTVADGDGGADGTPGACDPTTCDEACRGAGHSGGTCLGEGDDAYCGCSTGGDDGCGCRAAGAAAPLGGLLTLLLGLTLLAVRRRR